MAPMMIPHCFLLSPDARTRMLIYKELCNRISHRLLVIDFYNIVLLVSSVTSWHSEWKFPYISSNETAPWWRHQMEIFSALLGICAWNSPITGEFPAQRPVRRSFDGFFDLRLKKRLSKQWWGWWFETPSCQLWPHCNANTVFFSSIDSEPVTVRGGGRKRDRGREGKRQTYG